MSYMLENVQERWDRRSSARVGTERPDRRLAVNVYRVTSGVAEHCFQGWGDFYLAHGQRRPLIDSTPPPWGGDPWAQGVEPGIGL